MVLILAIIFLVSYPNFVSMSKKEKTNKQQVLEKNLCLAGESYIYSNKLNNNMSVGSKIVINVNDLISSGYVDDSKQELCPDLIFCTKTLTFTVNSDKSLDCQYN